MDFIGPNYAYIVLYITQSGPLEILIDGNATTGFLDVAIFNVPQGVDPCVATLNTANQIGCNYAIAASGCNQFGTFFGCPSFIPAPNVTAGDVLMIVVENSFFENIYALRIYGNDTYIRNSTFNNSGFIVSTGDNTVFTNNTMTNSWTFWELVIPYGENAFIAGNTLNNGSAGFGLYNSDNNIVRDNVCNNYVGYCLRLDNTNNTLVSNNFFSNKTS